MTTTGDGASNGWVLRVGWLVAAVGLPSAVGGTWRHLVARHPVIAFRLLLAYCTALAVARFASGIAGGLTELWRGRLVERIDQVSVRHLSRFGKRYADYVLGSLRFIDQKGQPTVGFYTPALDDVFVDVSLARRPLHQASADPLADLPADVTERLSLNDFLDRDEPVVLAVTGAPGSGKTTLLRHTARQICRSRRGRRRHVPILLYLRDHVDAIVEGSEDGLPSLLHGTLGRYGPEPAGWFEQRLRDGDCVILLDGLDEVAQDKDRRTVSAWVERQIVQYPMNDYVITSRPHGYRTAPVEGATVLQTRRFTEEQVIRFVRGWYLAVERRSTGADGEDVRMLATSGADDLLERLKSAPALYELTANPLLLTMIANVHRFRGALPGSRADLYRDICEVMLWRRHEAKKLTAKFAGEHKEVLLQGLAFTMMQRNLRDLAASEILTVVSPGLSRLAGDLSAQVFLDEVGSSGLLIERENGVYSFTHHTFQEYLAAAHIREKGLADALAQTVDDVWWRETTLLYAARADADLIVGACLDSGSANALTLAFDCAEQGTELAQGLRRRLDEFVARASDPRADPDGGLAVKRVLAAPQLRRLVLVANGRRVCAQPITQSTYQLFLRDMDAQGQNRSPDGPQSASSSEDAVSGVRGGDAGAFVRWINDLVGDPSYRLPTREEMDDPAARQALGTPPSSLWLQGGGDHPERWTATGIDQPHAIKVSAIADRLTRDVESSAHLLRRLLLVRSAAAALLLARAPDASAVDLALESALALSISLDLDHDLTLARRLPHASARNLGLTGIYASYLDGAANRARDLVRGPTATRDPYLARDLARDLTSALDLDRRLYLDFHLDPARDLTGDV